MLSPILSHVSDVNPFAYINPHLFPSISMKTPVSKKSSKMPDAPTKSKNLRFKIASTNNAKLKEEYRELYLSNPALQSPPDSIIDRRANKETLLPTTLVNMAIASQVDQLLEIVKDHPLDTVKIFDANTAGYPSVMSVMNARAPVMIDVKGFISQIVDTEQGNKANVLLTLDPETIQGVERFNQGLSDMGEEVFAGGLNDEAFGNVTLFPLRLVNLANDVSDTITLKAKFYSQPSLGGSMPVCLLANFDSQATFMPGGKVMSFTGLKALKNHRVVARCALNPYFAAEDENYNVGFTLMLKALLNGVKEGE